MSRYLPIFRLHTQNQSVHHGVLVQHNLRSVRTPIGAMEHPGEGLGYYDYTAGDTASAFANSASPEGLIHRGKIQTEVK